MSLTACCQSTNNNINSFSTVAGSVSPTKVHGSEFFAVASGVQIPYVGRDETGLNASRVSTPPFPDEYPSRLAHSSIAPLVPPIQHKQLPKDEPLARLADVFSQYHSVADKSSKDISRSYLKKLATDWSSLKMYYKIVPLIHCHIMMVIYKESLRVEVYSIPRLPLLVLWVGMILVEW